MDEVHYIDPGADTVLLLKNPGAPFAIWENSTTGVETTTPKTVSELDALEGWGLPPRKKKKGKKGKATIPVPSPPAEDLSEPEPAIEEASPLPPPPDSTTEQDPDPEPTRKEEPFIWGTTRKKGKTGKGLKKKSLTMVWKEPTEEKAPLDDDPTESIPVVEDPMEGSSRAHESLFGNGGPEVEAVSPPEEVATMAAPTDHETDVAATTPEPPVVEEEEGVRFMVSSRHLALASKFFKTSLKKEGWVEGRANESDNLYHLTAADWDPEALLIFLNVLHLRNRRVPRVLKLEMLAKIAVLVDYYQCTEALDVFSELWISAAKKISPVPEQYGRCLMLWICVAWVFKLPTEFKQTTEIAFRQCEQPTVKDLLLPIPKRALDAMERKRYVAIEAVLANLHKWLETFRSSAYRCSAGEQYSHVCGAVLFGALTKEMDRIGCIRPRPEVPFQGWSFKDLTDKVQGMISPSWYDSNDRYKNNHPHSCRFEETVKAEVSAIMIETGSAGLTLSKFIDRSGNA